MIFHYTMRTLGFFFLFSSLSWAYNWESGHDVDVDKENHQADFIHSQQEWNESQTPLKWVHVDAQGLRI